MAIGHNRYSTAGGNDLKNVQPLSVNFAFGNLALSHNGNLINAQVLRHELEAYGAIFQSTSDSEVIIHLIAHSRADTLLARIIDALTQVRGAYSVVLQTDEGIIAVRDPHGFRPLCLGRLGDTYLVASETCAFDLLGAEVVREIEPGEIVIIRRGRLRSVQPLPRAPEKLCVFEHIYFARPDSLVFGASVYQTRKQLGRELARESPVVADMVVPVLDSGSVAALGYAEISGIPYENALIRNHYVRRTFIEPEQSIRMFGVRVKHNPIRELVAGKSLVVVEDSIVRGTTLSKLVTLFRAAGAREVHIRVSSPPTTGPCYYGIDTPKREELIAATHSVEEIRRMIGADSLAFLSLGALRRIEAEMKHGFCDACFSGEYIIPVDEVAPPDPQLRLFETSASEPGADD
jgi:amidophosphoribosyltransferase